MAQGENVFALIFQEHKSCPPHTFGTPHPSLLNNKKEMDLTIK